MRAVILSKFFGQYDDTEFSILMLEKNGNCTVYVQWLCGHAKPTNRVIATKCSEEKFERIREMYKRDRLVEELYDGHGDDEKFLDHQIDGVFQRLRRAKGLESGWFNGHTT